MPETTSTPKPEGRSSAAKPRSAPNPVKKGKATPDLWRRPFDLSPGLANRLLHGLAANHRRRLAVFARQGERVPVGDLLAVTGDSDLRVLSYFQGALSRKLRRLVGDRDKKVHLIGWDYTATKWDEEHSKIVDGVCYVSEATRTSLIQCLGGSPDSHPGTAAKDAPAKIRHRFRDHVGERTTW